MTKAAGNLDALESYINSCVALAQEKLHHFSSLAEIAAREKEINRYPGLNRLEEPRQILILDEHDGRAERLSRAKEAVVRGEILFEHAAAGEGTRLMLGSKYFLNLTQDLTIESIANLMSQEAGRIISPAEVAASLDCSLRELLPLSLGARHMLQLAFDLENLAREVGESPREVLRRQHLLIIISREMLAHVEKDFYLWHFFGFNPAQVYFMVQESFHGLNFKGGRFFYDVNTPLRLHNHGQMVMQETMEHQLFSLMGTHPWDRLVHAQQEVLDWLHGFADKISYNIEDLDYLTGSLDFPGLGLALELGDQGFNMVMEVMANNPLKPQKGGMLAWDSELGCDVMIESFQLGDIQNQDIKFLNRNFNHYPKPHVSWKRIREEGLPMPITVKGGYLYFMPVQGDINFLVQTAFFRRQEMRPIRNLKSPAALPLAVNRMYAQDCQPGFKDFAQRCRQGSL
ncbi:MAG: hypothetical protein ACOZFS_13565 [Thermodesulfobacteriota bacterium]